MALNPCAECGAQISSRARACPQCGCPVEAAAEAPGATLNLPPGATPATDPAAPPTTAPAPEHLAVEAPRWSASPPTPWRRFLARNIDGLLIGFLGAWGLGLLLTAAPGVLDLSMESTEALTAFRNHEAVQLAVVMLSTLIFSAFLIGEAGATPGKWAMGLRVLDPEGRPIGFKAALQREFQVLFYGLGLGVPVVSLVTLSIAYSNVMRHGHARWDPPELHQVRHETWSLLTRLRAATAVSVWAIAAMVLSILNAARSA